MDVDIGTGKKNMWPVQVKYTLNRWRKKSAEGSWLFDSVPGLCDMIIRCCADHGDGIAVVFTGNIDPTYCDRAKRILEMESFQVSTGGDKKTFVAVKNK